MPDTQLLFLTGDAAEEAGDFASARRAFERGAALGDDSCWLRLGLIFDLGSGVAVDKAEAMRCYRRAWLKRNTAAALNIAVLYRERGNRRAMFRWLRKAADAGDGSAYLDMAKCYLAGIGVRKSAVAAVRCLAAALTSSYISEAEREEAGEIMQNYRPRLA